MKRGEEKPIHELFDWLNQRTGFLLAVCQLDYSHDAQEWSEIPRDHSSRIPMTAKASVRRASTSLRKVRKATTGDTNLMFANVTTNRLIPTGTQSRTGIEATATTISLPPTRGRMTPTLGKGSDTKNRDSSGPQRPGNQLWHPSQPVRFLGLLTMHGCITSTTWPQHTGSLPCLSLMELARRSLPLKTYVDAQRWLWHGK